jgi:hypothetical protein
MIRLITLILNSDICSLILPVRCLLEWLSSNDLVYEASLFGNCLHFLLSPETLSPLCHLLLAEGSKQRHGLADLLRFLGQTQEYLEETLFVLVDETSKGIVTRRAFLKAEKEVDFGTAGGHERFHQEGLEADEVSDDVHHHVGSEYALKYLLLSRLSLSQKQES